jgi:F0F1-type ATP synthase epsilon subunit
LAQAAQQTENFNRKRAEVALQRALARLKVSNIR